MIRFENVSKSFKDGDKYHTILNRASTSFNDGQKNCIVGRSGLGKSTVLKLISSIESADEGSIYINDINISTASQEEIRSIRQHLIGYVFQSFNLIKSLTVEENILLPTFFLESPSDLFDISYLLDVLNLPSSILKQDVSTISGGEKQRVAIARALINKPRILLADEPTGNLDSNNEENVLKLFDRITNELDMTLVIVTHSSKVAANCDCIVTIENGEFQQVKDAFSQNQFV